VMKAACDRMDGYTDNQSNVFFSTSWSMTHRGSTPRDLAPRGLEVMSWAPMGDVADDTRLADPTPRPVTPGFASWSASWERGWSLE
jgi:hypothetical protein